MLALVFVGLMASSLNAETSDGIKKRLADASASVRDLKGTMVVHPASKSDAKEINKGIIEFLDHGFREAKVHYRRPDRFRAQGKAKGMDVTYIMNGDRKQVIAPALMLRKTENLSRNRAKKQSTLDMGFASDSLWRDNNVRVVSESNGVVQLQLIPVGATGKRKELIWLDSRTLKLIKRERYKGNGKLKTRQFYSNHKMMGKMPIATLIKVYSADGGFAGSIDYKDLAVNTGVAESLFAIQ
jgi:outer membrane lipoprotein-sorting protein